MRQASPWLAIAGLILLALGACATAARGGITVTPQHPASQDTLRVAVSDVFTGSCWEAVSIACNRRAPDTLLAEVTVQYCDGQPRCGCLAVIVPYTLACDAGPLPPGRWTIAFVERRLNAADPRVKPPEYATLTIDGPTHVPPRTWGALKGGYR